MPTGFRPAFVCLNAITCAQTGLTCCSAIPEDNKDYWLPDVGEQVEVLLDANGEDGVILGAVYSDVDKPPFSDKNIREPGLLMVQSTATTGRRTL